MYDLNISYTNLAHKDGAKLWQHREGGKNPQNLAKSLFADEEPPKIANLDLLPNGQEIHSKLAKIIIQSWQHCILMNDIEKTDLWSNSVVPIKFHKKCQSQGEISHFFKLSVLAFFTLSMTYRFRVLPGLKGVSTFEFALVQNDLTCKNFCELLNFSELCPCLNFFLKKTNNVDSSQKSPCM